MKITRKIYLLALLVFCFSCEDQGLIIKCPDCLEEEPFKTTMELKLNMYKYGSMATLITVYEGNIEDNIVFDTFQTKDQNETVTVFLNKKYTITATYFVSPDTYIAVDSATPKVRYEKSQCDSPCYFVYDKVLDLRLKYTK